MIRVIGFIPAKEASCCCCCFMSGGKEVIQQEFGDHRKCYGRFTEKTKLERAVKHVACREAALISQFGEVDEESAVHSGTP